MPYCPECSASVPSGAAACPTCGASLVSTPAADEASPPAASDLELVTADLRNSVQPQYELLRVLGTGGMGAVFLLREPALLLPGDRFIVRMFSPVVTIGVVRMSWAMP